MNTSTRLAAMDSTSSATTHNERFTMKRILLSLAILTLLFSSHRANAQRPVDPLPRGWLIKIWTVSPSSPNTVSTSDGWVNMSPGASSFTTPAQGATAETSFTVDFAAANSNVANCIAGIALTGNPIAAFYAGGYVTPTNSPSNFVSARAEGFFKLYGSTTYTITPQVAARGTGATCSMTSAFLLIHLFTAEDT
jgi:hypothetical protein